MKKFVTLGVTALAALTLAACGSNSSSKGVDTVKSSKVSKSSSSKKPTKASLQVTNGSPEKVGQWKYMSDVDADGTLVKVSHPNTKIGQGKFTESVESIKIYQMKPKSDDAKKTVSDGFGVSGVTDPYYLLQVNWTAHNADKQELQTNGVKSIVVNGQQYSSDSGMQDEGAGSAVAAGAQTSFQTNVLLKSSDYKSIKQIAFNLDTVVTTTSFDEVAGATNTTINL